MSSAAAAASDGVKVEAEEKRPALPETHATRECNRLVRMVVRAFYTSEYHIVIDHLLEMDLEFHHLVPEKELAARLHLGDARLHKMLAQLQRDRLIVVAQEKTEKEEELPAYQQPSAASRRQRIKRVLMHYTINYSDFISIVKIRNSLMSERLNTRVDRTQQMFVCTNSKCSAAGKEYDLLSLMETIAFSNTGDREFRCPQPTCQEEVCGALVGRKLTPSQDSLLQRGGNQDALMHKLNTQMRVILDQMAVCERALEVERNERQAAEEARRQRIRDGEEEENPEADAAAEASAAAAKSNAAYAAEALSSSSSSAAASNGVKFEVKNAKIEGTDASQQPKTEEELAAAEAARLEEEEYEALTATNMRERDAVSARIQGLESRIKSLESSANLAHLPEAQHADSGGDGGLRVLRESLAREQALLQQLKQQTRDAIALEQSMARQDARESAATRQQELKAARASLKRKRERVAAGDARDEADAERLEAEEAAADHTDDGDHDNMTVSVGGVQKRVADVTQHDIDQVMTADEFAAYSSALHDDEDAFEDF